MLKTNKLLTEKIKSINSTELAGDIINLLPSLNETRIINGVMSIFRYRFINDQEYKLYIYTLEKHIDLIKHKKLPLKLEGLQKKFDNNDKKFQTEKFDKIFYENQIFVEQFIVKKDCDNRYISSEQCLEKEYDDSMYTEV